MKKRITKKGSVMKSREKMQFMDMYHAITAANAMAWQMAIRGYLVTTTLDPEVNTYEVNVYFNLPKYPTTPDGYNYSSYSIHSHVAIIGKEVKRIRVKTYSYKVKA